MNPTEIPLKSPSSVTDLSIGEVEQVERALIDASTRVPVLMFYASAVVWLLLGTLLAAFTSFKLHSPDLLSNVAVLTWGRIRPAHLNVMLYGWASMVGMGTAIWLMARLCRTTLRHPLVLVTGGAFWNLGVLWNLRNSDGRQHRLSLARISQLCRVDSFCWLLADRFLGGPNVPVSSRRSDLHHAMVSARCVSLVPVDVPGCANHAFYCAGAGRVAGRG
ncbi:MAG: hypothetical protein DME27_05725 [Verrucomicrobia bacterium]|nr:MAG: hypothetical protein DME27_05725 [Verrucomicrobiota bacterium]